jgi:type 2 lantibiotic biosynthesis protein LanM
MCHAPSQSNRINPGCTAPFAWSSSSRGRALTLHQRRQCLGSTSPAERVSAIDLAAGARRLSQWRSQYPFQDESCFVERVAADGLSEEAFQELLGTSAESLAAGDDSTWQTEWELAWEAWTTDSRSPWPSCESADGLDGFLNLAAPLAKRALGRLIAQIEEIAAASPVEIGKPAKIAEMFLPALRGRLAPIVSRTLALELNVDRLQEKLHGDTAEERFRDFAARLLQPERAGSILDEYPVLARHLAAAVENWLAFAGEFVNRLFDDWSEIVATLNAGKEPGSLASLDSDLGDSHRHGRSVIIAEFTSGLKVVYKPRPLAVDVHFQELLAWLNRRGASPSFRALRVLDRGDHGWVEFVERKDCQDEAEVRRFYRRQGGNLAILYTLRATDFHFGNLIAAGEHPVLIDLETLFHPRLSAATGKNANLLALNNLAESVFAIGLLPYVYSVAGQAADIDMSGLGASSDPLTLNGAPQWEQAGTDEMRLVHRKKEYAGKHSRPVLRGTAADFLEYADEICQGFENVYRILNDHRDALLGDRGPLAAFTNDEVRVVLRATQKYAILVRESFRPDVLRDALDRERLFDHLWRDTLSEPYLAQVIGAEREQLDGGDIPIFTTRADSRDLELFPCGQISDFFSESGIAAVRKQIESFSDKDLDRQLHFIRAAFAASAMGKNDARWPRYAFRPRPEPVSQERFLEAARTIGDRLESLAVREGDEVSWIGLGAAGNGRWRLAPLGVDLYSGLPGVVLFLAYLGEVTGEMRYRRLAESALSTMQRLVECNRSTIHSLGAFNGWGGLIYANSHLASLWGRTDLATPNDEMLDALSELVEHDVHLDLIGGAAGLILGLTSLPRSEMPEKAIHLMRRCGDRLVETAQSMPGGAAWSTAISGGALLAGFSHGCAGIAFGLLQLAEICGDIRYRRLALEGIRYERSLYSPEERNWPDLRNSRGRGERHAKYMVAWCHGAVGIGLGRLACLPFLDDAAVHDEIQVAIQTTLAGGFGGNHSLCHGDLGNLDFLLQAALQLEDGQLMSQVRNAAAGVFHDLDRDGCKCGVPMGAETPGLMTGISGIGYALLRLAEPERVPSLLALSPSATNQNRRAC